MVERDPKRKIQQLEQAETAPVEVDPMEVVVEPDPFEVAPPLPQVSKQVFVDTLGRMQAKYRATAQLYVAGFSFDDIAQATGTSVGWVKKILKIPLVQAYIEVVNGAKAMAPQAGPGADDHRQILQDGAVQAAKALVDVANGGENTKDADRIKAADRVLHYAGAEPPKRSVNLNITGLIRSAYEKANGGGNGGGQG